MAPRRLGRPSPLGLDASLDPARAKASGRFRDTRRRRTRKGTGTIGRPRAGPVWLFDLDNTLHHASHAIFPYINREMTAFIERALAVDRETANRLRVAYTRRYGAALLGLVRRHGIDAHAFLREVHPSDTLMEMVRGERGLRRTLSALPGRKIVLTNGPSAYAQTILAALGIRGYFERVIAIEDMRRGNQWQAKPERTVMRRVLRQVGVPLAHASRATLVEDTHGHLKRYRRLGIRTVWITGFIPVRDTPARRASQAALLLARPAPDATADGTAVTYPVTPSAGSEASLRQHMVAPARITASRPHYVDHRVRTLARLRRH
ncbi:pyrimidine 5'-nucleotidase [Robbsia andropogonis]|nr:pyrimidine 5'-nucleotidase [Robbsia andropogonis]MCP1117767.1 pyrimidine 5'-nucleotidase [Robbsia andropogonis]MCP1127232.1 pyrimidine 5'-nucleotidase [Robbsia andropogonis]